MKFTFISMLLFSILFPHSLPAETKTWEISSFKHWTKGTGSGVWIDDRGVTTGTLWMSEVTLDEAMITDAEEVGKDLYIATGTEGRVYRVRDGSSSIVADFEDEIVIALAAGKKGKLYAATLPGNSIYEIVEDGFSLLEKLDSSVRDIAFSGGVLYAATAEPAAVFKFDGSKFNIVLEIDDAAAASISPDGKDGIYIGTYGDGLLIHLKQDGTSRALWQDDLDEISRVVPGLSGDIYFISNANPDEPSEEKEKKKDKKGKALSSRLSLYRSSGIVENLVTYNDKIILSLFFDSKNSIPVFGTAAGGEIYAWQQSRAVRVATLENEAVAAITASHVVTQESATVYNITPSGEHIYTSDILDTGNLARFGEVTYRGSGDLALQFRSGATKKPGPTWNEWGQSCSENPCSVRLTGRFAQFKVTLGNGSRLGQFKWAYSPVNLPPRITSFLPLNPGEIYLKSSYQPQNIVIQATNPDKYGIFTTLKSPPPRAGSNSKGKQAFMKGYRTFTWKVADPNGDELAYSLFYQHESESEWHEIFTRSKDTFFSFDTMVLPDGSYRFKLIASDHPVNSADAALSAEERSPVICIDNHAPQINFDRVKKGIRITVTDALSPVSRVEISRNGEPWEQLSPDDTIFDSRKESFYLKERSIPFVVRVMDTFYNVETASYDGGEK